MRPDAEGLAALVIQTVKGALVPVLREVQALEQQLNGWESRWSDMGALRERVAVLEVRQPIPGPPGPPGEKGDTGVPGEQGAQGLNGKDGEPGLNGKDGASGLNGKDGSNGLDGKDGKDGAPGLNGNDGAPGLLGVKGDTGDPGPQGLIGPAGPDGVGITEALIGRDGQLVLLLSDGRTKAVGVVVGKDGAPGLNGKDGSPGIDGKDGANGRDGKDGASGLNGKDGADGWGFDDLDVAFDESTGYVLRFSRGDRVKDFPVPLGWDAGVWQSGRTYPKGAGVTVKGAWWIAQEDTSARPGDETAASRAWRLAVKGGRDGKPGRDGRDAVGDSS